jgi:hypothetical protein
MITILIMLTALGAIASIQAGCTTGLRRRFWETIRAICFGALFMVFIIAILIRFHEQIRYFILNY